MFKRLFMALAVSLLALSVAPAPAQARPDFDNEIIPTAPVIEIDPDGYVVIYTPMDCLDICIVDPCTDPDQNCVDGYPADEHGDATPPWVTDPDNHDGEPGYPDA